MIGLALLAALGWGAADFLGGLSRADTLVFSVLAISELIGAAMIGPALALTPIPHWSGHLWLACLAGVGVTVELGVVYYALSIGAAFITAPVGAIGAALTVTAGLLGGDPLTPLIAVGLACAVIGGGLSATGGTDSTDGDHRLPGPARLALACLIASAGVGLMQITLHAAGKVDPYWAAELEHLATAASAGVVVLAVALRRRSPTASEHRGPITPRRSQLPLLALVALTGAGGDVAYAAASSGALSTVSAIASLYPIPTIALASAVQHRRARPVQALGILLALAGAAILGAVAS